MKSLALSMIILAGLAWQGTSTAQQPTVEDVLDKVREKWNSVEDYHVKMRSRNRLGEQQDEKKYDFYYKKPHLVRMEVIEGDKKGSVLVLQSDKTIRGKTGGVLGFVSVTLAPDDERIKNLRGREFYKADWGTVIKEYIAGYKAGYTMQLLKDEVFNNVDCWVLEANWKEAGNPITTDRIYVDKESHLVLCRKQSEGATLVNEVVWWDVQINPGLAADLFAL